jgi:hypothetical protein
MSIKDLISKAKKDKANEIWLEYGWPTCFMIATTKQVSW